MRLSALTATFAAGAGEFVLRTIGEVARVGMRCGSKAASRRDRRGIEDRVDEGDLAK